MIFVAVCVGFAAGAVLGSWLGGRRAWLRRKSVV